MDKNDGAASLVRSDALLEALSDCIDALKTAETYLVERGIECKGTVGRTQVLPRIRAALKNAADASNTPVSRVEPDAEKGQA